ncbi:MAG: rhodanese-like domain-containing protein [Hyphomicrobiaceae bacterium]
MQRRIVIAAVALVAAPLVAFFWQDDETAYADIVHNVSVRQAEQRLKADPKVVVLDIRTLREFRSGHIAGAVNIDFHSRNYRRNLAQLDAGKTYLLYCERGVRSYRSLGILKELGFRDILHMKGGMSAWRRAGQKLVKE